MAMNAQEMRQQSDAELAREIEGAYRALQNLRFRLATRQLTNTSEIRATKKTIARLNTIIRERELARG